MIRVTQVLDKARSVRAADPVLFADRIRLSAIQNLLEEAAVLGLFCVLIIVGECEVWYRHIQEATKSGLQ